MEIFLIFSCSVPVLCIKKASVLLGLVPSVLNLQIILLLLRNAEMNRGVYTDKPLHGQLLALDVSAS